MKQAITEQTAFRNAVELDAERILAEEEARVAEEMRIESKKCISRLDRSTPYSTALKENFSTVTIRLSLEVAEGMLFGPDGVDEQMKLGIRCLRADLVAGTRSIAYFMPTRKPGRVGELEAKLHDGRSLPFDTKLRVWAFADDLDAERNVRPAAGVEWPLYDSISKTWAFGKVSMANVIISSLAACIK